MTPENMKQSFALETISCLLILLFTYTGISKLYHYSNFKMQFHLSADIRRFETFVWVLPVTDLLVAVMLTEKPLRPAGIILLFCLMLVFTVYVAEMLLTATHFPCSCGGVLRQMSWTQHLIFNIFFLQLATAGIFLQKKQRQAVQTPVQK